jgi:gliding motility-associated-like protein
MDSDGTIASYAWTLTSGSPGSLSNQNTNAVTLSGAAAGIYTLRLTVTDDDGAVGTDDIKVTVNSLNVAPTANAGVGKSITLPTNSTNFVGSGTDPEGPIASYVWEQRTGPTASLTNAGSSTVTVGVSVAGTYVFRLTVTDNTGNTDFDEVQLVVNAANVNQPPVAVAGPNRTITLPVNTLVLNGNGTDPEGSALTYLWEKSGGPTATLTNSNTATLSLSNLLEGTYSFRLTVTDDGMLSDQKSVTVNVLPQTVNQTPNANAGEDMALTLPTNSITLFGLGSDADGSIATYSWSKVSGPTATLTNQTTPSLTLTNLTFGAYVFRLTVVDDQTATGIDDVVLTVNDVGANQLPIANAGPDRIIILPSTTININGSGSDDGSINNYLWTKTGGPTVTLINSSKPVLTASDLVEGTYTFSLEVTDDQGVTSSDDMIVQVLSADVNQSPNVNAGTDVSLILPKNNTTLRGAASDGGSIVSYEWRQITGGASTMNDIDQPNLLLTNLTQGQYTFRLTATDNEGAIGSDDVTLTVLPNGTNLAPIANAGPDLSIKLPANSISINGIGNDIDGVISSYKWIKLNGPGATLGTTTLASLSISNLVEGKYTLRLTVTDNGGLSSSADIDLVVLPANFNQNPIANAGANVFVTLPVNTAILNGSGTDPDGTIATYSWSRRLGPASVTESGNNTQTLSLSNLTAGTYLYRLTITDDKGGNTFDEVSVFVADENAQIQNDPPVAHAGDDKVLPKGTFATTLTGSYEDTGLINRVEWTQLSGGDAVLEGADGNVLTLSNLKSGAYEFAFTVYDALDVSDTDEVTVTIEDHIVVDSKKFFSPNGDNQNDVWVLDADETKFENCNLVIFNSQGIKVFEAKPYQNNWNGMRNGQALPEDVYFFVLDCDGGKNSGSITLLR